jgi:hypothetical protein
MAEISVEKNSTIIFPAQFMTTVQEAIKMICGDGAASSHQPRGMLRRLSFVRGDSAFATDGSMRSIRPRVLGQW